MSAPVLVFGWGNPSRGDDALAPMLLDRIEAALGPDGGGAVELLTDFQLQVEHALDLRGRARVLFVDASADGAHAPFAVLTPVAARDSSISSHALSPQGLMQVFQDVTGEAPPPCTLLAIAGESFELGDGLSAGAAANLGAATDWALDWLGLDGAGTGA